MPPLADGFVARPETVPGLEAALVPGAAVALVPGEPPRAAPGWAGSSGKTQLAAGLAGSLWQSRAVDLLAWVNAASRASVLSGYAQAAAQLGLDHGVMPSRWRPGSWPGWTGPPGCGWWCSMTCGTRRTWTGLWPAGPAGRLLITAADAGQCPVGTGWWSMRCLRSASGRR